MDRSEYEEKIKTELQKLSSEIDQMAAKSSSASKDVGSEYTKQLKQLREKEKLAQKKLDEMVNASEAAAEVLKYGVEAAVTDLQNSLDRAMAKFK